MVDLFDETVIPLLSFLLGLLALIPNWLRAVRIEAGLQTPEIVCGRSQPVFGRTSGLAFERDWYGEGWLTGHLSQCSWPVETERLTPSLVGHTRRR